MGILPLPLLGLRPTFGGMATFRVVEVETIKRESVWKAEGAFAKDAVVAYLQGGRNLPGDRIESVGDRRRIERSNRVLLVDTLPE